MKTLDLPLSADIVRSLEVGDPVSLSGVMLTGRDAAHKWMIYRFVAAGPTTSTREEPYQGEVMQHFDLRAVIGKGGMGPKTLDACATVPGVYLHAIGGAATLIAQSVRAVRGVHKLNFGVPEAMWVIEVEGFPAVVTMDSHGNSLHAEIEAESARRLETLLKA
ncbi:MAG: fumarate hydratase C-terminal domain-containing protein [Anaerolineales bacterium]